MNLRFWSQRGALLAAAMFIVAPNFASAEDIQGAVVPNVAVSPVLKAARMKGVFTAKILPRKGYAGPVLIGNVPERHLQSKAPSATSPNESQVAAAMPNFFYPDDLGYYGGATLAAAGQVNTYWGASNGSTWGYPATYLALLNNSAKIRMLDFYTGDAYNSYGQYPSLSNYWHGGAPGALVYDSGIATLVQTEATADRTTYGLALGYSNIYHVYTPPGTDVCFDNPANGCYNPDGLAPGPFAFCGYHSYTTLSDGTLVIYTVEPYTHVSGCSTGYDVASDTANVLGHELAETVTDPIPGTGWVGEYNTNSGSEIGDECSWVTFPQALPIGRIYYVQNWYSNKYHGCATVQ